MHFPVIRQSLRLEAELLQLYQTLTLVDSMLMSLSIPAIAIHRCRRHPSLPSPSTALPSHSAIPKVGNRTPTVQTARLTVVQNVTSSNQPSLQEALQGVWMVEGTLPEGASRVP